MARLGEIVRETDEGGAGSWTAELNVPNSSSTEAVGVCLVILDGGGFDGGLYVGGEYGWEDEGGCEVYEREVCCCLEGEEKDCWREEKAE
jgi:hypothetical protein